MTRWNPETVRFSLLPAEPVKAEENVDEAVEAEAVGGEGKPVASEGEEGSAVPPAASVPVASSVSQATAVYEHPLVIRITHWVNAISLTVMILSGLQIFAAFPSFAAKVPQHNLVTYPSTFTPFSVGGWFRGLALGGWLAGAWNWHFLFVWPFVISGVLYFVYQVFSGRFRALIFVPSDIPGVWPMVKHYFFLRKKPPLTQQYNPLQKLAYTSTIFFGVVSVLSGLVIFNPVQFSWLGTLMGGFHYARVWHFIAMCGFLAFIPGHLIMVAIHGWNNFMAMLTGWKRDPEYLDGNASGR
jgi:Ni/Fe-hydrogenase b-type cytochrome subunit